MEKVELNLKVNQKIIVADHNKEFKCNIQDIKEDVIYIDPILTSESSMKILHFEDTVNLYINISGKLYRCTSKVLGYKRDQNIRLAALTMPVVVDIIQRREFFRLPIIMDCSYYILPENCDVSDIKKLEENYDVFMEKTTLLDISGGGIRIITNIDIKRNIKLLLHFNVQEDVYVVGKVVKTNKDEELGLYKISLNFVNLNERKRDKIINFIFNKTRETLVTENNDAH